MITNFILIMVVLKFTSSVPQQDDSPWRRFPGSFRSTTRQAAFRQRYPTSSWPYPLLPSLNPDIGPSGIVELDGISVGSQDSGCIFGGASYATGDYLDDTCLELRCSNGTWTSTGKEPRSVCGKCVAWGDPHMQPYESPVYEIFTTGDFAITQHGFGNPSTFGVNGKFEKCADHAKSCIRSISYYEPGLTVTLGLPTSAVSKSFCSLNSHNANSATCVTTVNGRKHTPPIGTEALQFTGRTGTILVFEQNGITGRDDLYCIAIVGSKGLSMALCQHLNNWPFLYVYAMPSLKRPTPSLLYGLCDVYTRGGNPSKEYTMRSKATTKSTAAFVHSWKV